MDMLLELRDGVVTTMLLDGILEVTLNRPAQLNALNQEVLRLLKDIFLAAKACHEVRAILIKGAGRGFCAGADIHELASLNDIESGTHFIRAGQHILNDLSAIGKPSLAVVHGFALGGGCELAMATTLCIAEEHAVFGQPEIKLGIIPGFGGTQRLARFIGIRRALDWCLTGRQVSAKEAHALGLVNQVTDHASLWDLARQYLKNIIIHSADAIHAMIDSVQGSADLPLREGLAWESVYFGVVCSTDAKAKAVNAFIEKSAMKKDKET